MIDQEKIVSALTSMKIMGDDRGLISAFGVYLTRMYSDYYNKISFRMQKESLSAVSADMRNMAEILLVEAGHVCAFNTFGGIMKSDEWKGLIQPMIEKKEDWVYGIVAVINALGWGVWKVEELIPGEKLKISVRDGYEQKGFLKEFGKSEIPRCYLATGGVNGIMNLLYYGDITTSPDLTEDYYKQLFSTSGSFRGHEHQCTTMGHPFCLFESSRDVMIVE